MVARPRKIGQRDLPLNLYRDRGYFKYLHPVTRKFVGLGRNKKEAIEAANKANSLLLKSNDLVDKITGVSNPFSKFLDKFENKLLPDRDLAEKTVHDYKQKIVHIRKEFKKPVDEINVFDIRSFLDKFPRTQSNRYRSLLDLIFQYAIADGLTEENPAAKTMKQKETVKRQRLSIEGYQAILECASMPIKNAMELALLTLQRREDLSCIQWSNIQKDCLCIVQKKTGALVKITLTPQLKAVLSRSKDNVLSPYVIHQGFKTNKARRGKRLNPDSLSKGFLRARKESGYYDSLPAEEKPSFHEIRALGAELYRKAKYPELLIQKLLGHRTQEMTRKYLDRHEIDWDGIEPIYAELNLEKL